MRSVNFFDLVHTNSNFTKQFWSISVKKLEEKKALFACCFHGMSVLVNLIPKGDTFYDMCISLILQSQGYVWGCAWHHFDKKRTEWKV